MEKPNKLWNLIQKRAYIKAFFENISNYCYNSKKAIVVSIVQPNELVLQINFKPHELCIDTIILQIAAREYKDDIVQFETISILRGVMYHRYLMTKNLIELSKLDFISESCSLCDTIFDSFYMDVR